MYAKILKDGEASRKAWIKRGLGIARIAMPQIKSSDMPEFLEYAKQSGVATIPIQVKANLLKPSQSEVNPEQVSQMPLSSLKKPILTSLDNFVLDGHNRWARMAQESPTAPIDVLQMQTKAKQALVLMHSFPKSFKKSVDSIGATKQ